MGDKWNETEILEKANFMADKEKTIKRGDNVLHIDYINGLLSNDDLAEFELKLKTIGIELSSYDKSLVHYNSLDELTGVVRQVLSSGITHDIIIGVVGSAVWEGLCKIWLLGYKRLKGKKITKWFAGGHKEIKDATMSIVLVLNATTSIEYNLRGNVENENEALETFNRILEHAKSLPINDTPKRPLIAEANFKTRKIKVIDEMKFIQNQISKQKKNKKKGKKKTGQ